MKSKTTKIIIMALVLHAIVLQHNAFAATTLTACQIINTPGTYVLTADITDQDGNCFEIQTSNVTLDCQGHVIDGDGDSTGYGIYVDAYNYGILSNITIENCTIKEFSYGIRSVGISSNYIIDSSFAYITAINNYATGIRIEYPQNINLTHILASYNVYDGMSITDGKNIILKNINSSYNGVYGISISSTNTNITDSYIAYNDVYGVYWSRYYSPYGHISNSTIIKNDQKDIYLYFLYCSSSDNPIYIYNNTLSLLQNIRIKQDYACVHLNYSNTGNHWLGYDSDHEGCTDANADKICDIPYKLLGEIHDYYPVYANKPIAYHYCNSCSNCTHTINYIADYNDIVMLSQDINASSTCLPIKYIDAITFDCNNHKIEGSGTERGIEIVEDKDNLTIKNCYLVNWDEGIYSSHNNNLSLINITLWDNDYRGIDLYYGSYIYLNNINSSFNSAAEGIEGYMTNYVNINNSVFEKNEVGIKITSSYTYHISNSLFKNNFDYDIDLYNLLTSTNIEACNQLVFENLTNEEGLPLSLINENQSIKDKEFALLVLCNVHNITVENVTLKGSLITKNNYLASYFTSNITFVNINTSFNKKGIIISKSTNNTLLSSFIEGNDDKGIEIYSSENTAIIDNLIKNNYYGISTDTSSENITITKNYFANNDYGVYLRCNNNRITNNEIVGDGGGYGIYLDYSDNNIIENNQISSKYYGVYFYYGADSNLLNNLTITQIGLGIGIRGNNNKLYNINIENPSYEGLSFSYGYAYNSYIENVTITNSGRYDVFTPITVSSESACDVANTFKNVTGSEGLPVGFYNHSVVLKNKEFSQLILCNADNSIIENISVPDKDNLDNNNIAIYFSDNISIENINTDNAKYNSYPFLIYKSNNLNIKNISFQDKASLAPTYIIYIRDSNNLCLDNISAKRAYYLAYFSYSNNITAKNLDFRDYTNYGLVISYYENYSILDSFISASSAGTGTGILIQGTKNVLLRNTTIINASIAVKSYGVYTYFVEDVLMEKLNLLNFSARGIEITSLKVNKNNTIRDCYIHTDYANTQGIAIGYNATDVKAYSNYIHAQYPIAFLSTTATDYEPNAFFYNNILESETASYVSFGYLANNTWNTSLTKGPNIVFRPLIGGNAYLTPAGDGFSQQCNDTDHNGICDTNYTLAEGNIDYLPLAISATYPLDPEIYVGNQLAWSYDGLYKGKETINIATALKTYIMAYCVTFPCTVPLKVKVSSRGMINISNTTFTFLEPAQKIYNIKIENGLLKDADITNITIISKDMKQTCSSNLTAPQKILRGMLKIFKIPCPNIPCSDLGDVLVETTCGIKAKLSDIWEINLWKVLKC